MTRFVDNKRVPAFALWTCMYIFSSIQSDEGNPAREILRSPPTHRGDDDCARRASRASGRNREKENLRNARQPPVRWIYGRRRAESAYSRRGPPEKWQVNGTGRGGGGGGRKIVHGGWKKWPVSPAPTTTYVSLSYARATPFSQPSFVRFAGEYSYPFRPAVAIPDWRIGTLFKLLWAT